MSNTATNKIFLIVSANKAKTEWVDQILKESQSDFTAYTAHDAPSALVKMKNVPPQVVIADVQNIKVRGTTFVDTVLRTPDMRGAAIIILQAPPEKESYLDEIAVGRVHFLGGDETALGAELRECIPRALAYAATGTDSGIHLRSAKANEVIIRKGDKAEHVFIVRRGRLKAYLEEGGQETELGIIDEGEFVGEMAIINGEPRSANVKAVVDCELIEIPVGTFESVLYQRPAWAKGMMRTLTKRLKNANKS